ncbi:uncharacterized protein LOC111248225 isoform X2 [Varroa destructor]|uniref:Monocarboxylate transporter n=1 Tax=Varroa destructor TaxID=109461 RepID=A0A7M7JR32_VARDE|nr:uncharacterized protein LOC111248225 isoform X2 [Varroa destructor]
MMTSNALYFAYQWTGPDCAWSWVIAAACSFLNFFTFALLRSGSVLFMNSLEYYKTSRASASWPPSLIIAVANLSGVGTGYLTKLWGPRRVALIGSVLSSCSIMACYFATDITRLIIFCGIFHGLGVGLNVPAIAVCLNLWFRDRKVTASGIIYTGAALGSFVYPIFFEWLIDAVGFRGSFLIFGALMLHNLPAALFIRSPPWPPIDSRAPSRQSSRRPSTAIPETGTNPLEGEGKDTDPAVDAVPPMPVLRRKSLVACSLSESSFDSAKSNEETTEQKGCQKIRTIGQHNHKVEPVLEELYGGKYNLTDGSKERYNELKEKGQNHGKIGAEQINHTSNSHRQDFNCCPQQGESASRSSMHTAARLKLRRSSSAISTNISLYSPAVPVSVTAEKDFEIEQAGLTFEEPKPGRVSPLIVLVGITYVLLINCNSAFQTILLDFAADKGVEIHHSVYLLSGFAVFDIAGRLAVGIISDMGLMSRSSLIGSAVLLFSVAMNLLPFVSGFIMLLSLTALVGFTLGTSVVLITVLVGDYVGNLAQVPLAVGWMAFFSGITGLTRPLIIGFFRDIIGNYDGMLQLMGSLMLACGPMWIGVNWYENYFKKKNQNVKTEPSTKTSTVLSTEAPSFMKATKASNEYSPKGIKDRVEYVTRL